MKRADRLTNLAIALTAMAPSESQTDRHGEMNDLPCWHFHRGCAMRAAAVEIRQMAEDQSAYDARRPPVAVAPEQVPA